MKKLVAVLAAVCLFFAGMITYKQITEKHEAAETETPAAEETAPEVTEPVSIPRELDIEALYASHAPEDIALTLDGMEVDWSTYFSWLYNSIQQVYSYFATVETYYGMSFGWEDAVSENGEETYADAAVLTAEDAVRQMICIEKFAEENSVKLTEEQQAELEEKLTASITELCGEGATQEDLEETLRAAYLSPELYRRIEEEQYLYQQSFNVLFGENGELVSDEDAMAFLTDNGYMRAQHILLATIDLSSGEALEDSVIEEKRAKAEEILTALGKITDPEELITAFMALKAENCEDTASLAYYPAGYVFRSGEFDPAFEEAYLELEDNELSGIVEGMYGFHIILRLPLDVDIPVDYSDAGTALTARHLFANNRYAELMQEKYDSMDLQYMPGFENLDLTKYIIR